MKCRKWVLLILGITCYCNSFAQNLSDIEKLLESNFSGEERGGYEEMVNTLFQLASAPLNLNTANFDSLKMLYFLSDAQIDQIITFRKKHGAFIHLNELLWVPGIGKRDIDNISWFVTLGEVSTRELFQMAQRRMKHEFLVKIRTTQPRQEGYTLYSPSDFDKESDYEKKVKNRFQGPNLGSLVKYKWRYGDRWQSGLVLENDPGEAYFGKYQKAGFDFLSAHLVMNSDRLIKQLILGDFRVQWGQGLIAWGAFSSGKSDMAVGNEKAGKGFVANFSTDENNYLRGVAASFKLHRKVTGELFYSSKKTDANVVAMDTLSEEELLSVSLTETGYHRNESEGQKKHTLKEQTAGLSIRWNSDAFKIGVQTLYYDFTPNLIRNAQDYQRYNETGDKRLLLSVDYKTTWRDIYLFGETARSETGAWATVNGIRGSLDWLSFCLLYRRYDKDYVSHYAAGFGEYSNTSNEEGIYCGVNLTPIKRLKLNFYYDRFRFFSARYGATIPGKGAEFLVQSEYQYKKWEHALRFKYEKRPEDLKGEQSVARRRGELRYQVNYQWNKQWEFRTRLAVALYHKAQVNEQGYLFFQDLIYATRNSQLKMQYRLAYFQTDSYYSRIYMYENNVLYGYSFPSFSGRGLRTYLNLTWKLAPRWTCYFKGGYLCYPNRESISSGVTKVDGNQLFDLTFQIRFAI